MKNKCNRETMYCAIVNVLDDGMPMQGTVPAYLGHQMYFK